MKFKIEEILVWVTPICLSISACAPIPYFHEATLNSTIFGKVIDGSTQKPISGAKVSIGVNFTKSDSNGDFKLLPIREKKYWKLLLIGPFDPAPTCKTKIEIDAMDFGYRIDWVEVNSCRYIRVLGSDFDKKNKEIVDSVGSVELLPLKNR